MATVLLVGVTGPGSAASPLPGQIVVDPDSPSWMQRHGEGSFFLCGPGDPEGFLYRGTLNSDGTRDGDQDSLIGKLTGTGANGIYLMAVRSHGGDGSSSENPFVDHDPGSGVNDAVLDQWERWFDAMESAGIVVFFIIYDDGAVVWNTGDSVGSEEEDFLWELVDRFEHHPNLIWCVAEEYNESYSRSRVRAIAATIRAADDHDHPIAVHETLGLRFDFPDDPDLDQFAMQWAAATPSELHDAVLTAWDIADGRYQLNFAELPIAPTRGENRRQMWAAALAGAYVMVLGMDIATTPVAQLEDCGHLAAFMERAPLTRMAPHDELEFGHTDYVLADPGHAYIAYATGATEELGIKSLPAGGYVFEWIDCATGDLVEEGPVFVESGHRSWPKPAGFGNEVAVLVRLHEATGSAENLRSTSWAKIKNAYRNR
jgi:hypothetical protein